MRGVSFEVVSVIRHRLEVVIRLISVLITVVEMGSLNAVNETLVNTELSTTLHSMLCSVVCCNISGREVRNRVATSEFNTRLLSKDFALICGPSSVFYRTVEGVIDGVILLIWP